MYGLQVRAAVRSGSGTDLPRAARRWLWMPFLKLWQKWTLKKSNELARPKSPAWIAFTCRGSTRWARVNVLGSRVCSMLHM